MRIILLSDSNSIKNVQGKKLAEFYTTSYYDWQFLDDPAVVEAAKDILLKPSWIIDSFPRNLSQCRMITEFDFAIYLKLNQESGKLKEVLQYFQQQNRLTTLNASIETETLFGEILDAILPF
ncbi:hypothetical protein VF04_03960 [Nostoc linckia z7]|uniref:Adenylate kinase n=3 Tax=Nostoc linckia TaxID=92942 RepID=A0A9Q6EN18_NOSLI|nr:hypothetical protein [Nostoc linckia]PHJ64950.1 hypothetical protein VF02_11445 [Nostoc linckia z1]PHJ70128.1 hypothetical protein VF05_11605 [Nostoc linckia z3]PHJ75029.1 hypothetical protein VF03_11765 [Nostoc linckia z2]PHJ89014.1 hypothetical protein VF07_13460 [Nostoc linckia z6]PHK00073.1 hypothetical protein VF04_03960 [Nostoc linckia z7]PHK06736.1 hypothetical protein VF08_03090 [Nostoc linckia z8]PHK23261.1 hypothetical protein VF11_02835 [Nostoc linckia z14]PHK42873.1 hypotheti